MSTENNRFSGYTERVEITIHLSLAVLCRDWSVVL